MSAEMDNALITHLDEGWVIIKVGFFSHFFCVSFQRVAQLIPPTYFFIQNFQQNALERLEVMLDESFSVKKKTSLFTHQEYTSVYT